MNCPQTPKNVSVLSPTPFENWWAFDPSLGHGFTIAMSDPVTGGSRLRSGSQSKTPREPKLARRLFDERRAAPQRVD